MLFWMALTVFFAAKIGIPISTTHSLTGALFEIGVANGQAEWGMIGTILLDLTIS